MTCDRRAYQRACPAPCTRRGSRPFWPRSQGSSWARTDPSNVGPCFTPAQNGNRILARILSSSRSSHFAARAFFGGGQAPRHTGWPAGSWSAALPIDQPLRQKPTRLEPGRLSGRAVRRLELEQASSHSASSRMGPNGKAESTPDPSPVAYGEGSRARNSGPVAVRLASHAAAEAPMEF